MASGISFKMKPSVKLSKKMSPKNKSMMKGGVDGDENNIQPKNIQSSIQTCPKCGNLEMTNCEMSKGYVYGQYGKCTCGVCGHTFKGLFRTIMNDVRSLTL